MRSASTITCRTSSEIKLEMGKKSVSFAPCSLIVSERKGHCPSSPEREAAKALERRCLPIRIKQLDVSLLMKIRRFVKYTGCKLVKGEITTPALIFAVELKNGKVDLVQCGPKIQGSPASIRDAFLLHTKVEMSKYLVDEDDWHYIEYRFKWSRARLMRFVWLDDMRHKLYEHKKKSLGFLISEREAEERERKERSLVGRAKIAYRVVKRVLGACIASTLPFSLHHR
ncbi:hypothetical protein BJX63DRAFT_397831 [Aspergillus granulosus]|uniref:Uncharacterized protein n=1 Tax=Aspergillus granulosus TaxID=176169 RepID=A0ABR4H944_9EURO